MWGMTLDLRSQALLISQGNSRADSWEVALFAGLGDKAGEYEKVYISPPPSSPSRNELTRKQLFVNFDASW